MIIKSKFSDYYDGGLVYGIDTDRFYIRETKEIQSWDSSNVNIDKYEIVGFCGEIYPIFNYSDKGFGNKWWRHPKDFVLYEDDALKYEFEKTSSYPNDTYKKIESKQKHWGESKESFFKNLKNNNYLKSLFITYDTPVFHIKRDRGIKLIINPCLSDIAFYKVKDTVQAFQDIEMYIGNILVKTDTKPQPVGSDLDILKSKGFDAKYSFRKEKS